MFVCVRYLYFIQTKLISYCYHQRNEQVPPVPEHSLNGGKKEQHILKMASLQLSNRTTPMMHLNLHAHHSPMQILLHLELDAVIPKLFYHIQKIDPAK